MIGVHPGPRNALTDVAGLLVGQAEDLAAWSGVTVVLAEPPALACADVRGGSPETFNTDALQWGGLSHVLHGLVFSGGSAFGLDAAGALNAWLAERGRGLRDWGACVPVVVGAAIFDLVNGGWKSWGAEPPYRRLAVAAAQAAGLDCRLGNAGAGYGAVAGTLKGGLGTVSAFDEASGVTVAALTVSNALGSTTMPGTPTFWAWHLEEQEELGDQRPPQARPSQALELKYQPGLNTTVGVVATDAVLDLEALRRLAMMAHSGYGYAIRPVATPLDGDVVFALSTARRPLPKDPQALVRLGALAADVVARSVMRGVYEAGDLGPHVSYRSRWAAVRHG